MVLEVVHRTDDVSITDLNRGEIALLRLMEDEGRVTPSYAADQVELSSSYVHDSLNALQSKGLVERVSAGLYDIAGGEADDE